MPTHIPAQPKSRLKVSVYNPKRIIADQYAENKVTKREFFIKLKIGLNRKCIYGVCCCCVNILSPASRPEAPRNNVICRCLL